MKKLIIDCSYIDFLKQPTGIPRVVLKYIENAYTYGLKNNVEIYPAVLTENGPLLCRPLPAADVAPSYLTNRVINDRIKIGVSNKFDICFFPSYWHDIPPKYFYDLKDMGASVIILVHDILPITFEKFYHAPWKYEFEKNVAYALDYADAIFCVSNYTKSSLLEFATKKNITPPPIFVAYNGYDGLVNQKLNHSNTLNSKLSIFDTDYKPFIMVGSIEPKKGHIPVITIFEKMWAIGLQRNLIIIGRRGWMYESVIETIESSPFFNKKLFWFDDLDDNDLHFCYNNSRALVFASCAEGFGIPMIEASNLGVPTIAFDTQINREILKNIGFFYKDAETFIHKINIIDNISEDELALIMNKWVKWFTWEEYLPSVFEQMNKVLGLD